MNSTVSLLRDLSEPTTNSEGSVKESSNSKRRAASTADRESTSRRRFFSVEAFFLLDLEGVSCRRVSRVAVFSRLGQDQSQRVSR